MALAVSSIAHGGTGNNSTTTVVTSSVSPAGNSLLMMWTASAKTGGLTVSSISGFGSTWTQVTSQAASSSTTMELWTCQLGGSPGSGTITITFSGSTTASEGYDLWQVTGHNTDTPFIATNTKTVAASSGTNPAITFNAAASTLNLFAFGVTAAANVTETPGANYSELTDASYTSPSVSLETQLSTDSTDVSASATPSVNSNTGAIGVEINQDLKVGVASLDHGGVSGNAGTTMVSNSVTPAANSLLMIWVAEAKTGGITVSSISGFSTWTQVTSQAASSSTTMELWTCQLGGSPGSSAVTVTFSASGSATESYDLWQITGHNSTTPLITSNTKKDKSASGENPTVAFGGAAGTYNRFAFGVCAGANVTQTPAANYTEVTDASHSGPSVSLETQISLDYTDTSAGSIPSVSAACASIGVEINSRLVSIPGVAGAILIRAPGTNAYDSLVLAATPVVYWNNTSGTDATGNGHTLTPFNSPGTAGSLPNGDHAYVFNGTTQYCETPDADSLSVLVTGTGGTGVGTYEAWIRPDVLTFPDEESDGYVYWGGKGTTSQYEFVHRMYGADNTAGRENRISGYAFNLSGGLGDGAYWETPGGETAGTWLHYTLVINFANTSAKYPNGYVTIYRNAVNTNIQTLAGITPGNGTAPLRIGTRDFTSYFEGAIGKYAIYNYELTPAQVAAHYNAMLTGSSGPAQASGGANVTGTAAPVAVAAHGGTAAGNVVTTLRGFSSVPGQQVPGQFDPAFLTALPLPGPVYHNYYGHYVLYYLDYADQITGKTLVAVPGGSYSMTAANSRAGLTVPPPDNRWDTPGLNYFLRRTNEAAVTLARGRAHNADLQARLARGEKIADLEARLARGESLDAG